MFKFMKSKKGFSLVELMIVVVIMAILVAVAVPIYNSVTANARAKTCIDNQRSIINSLGNYLMLNGVSITGETKTTFTITTNGDGDGASYGNFTGDTDIKKELLDKVFQTIPYCPLAGSVITVTVGNNTDDAASVITTVCKDSKGAATVGHQLNPGTSA